MVSFDCNSTLLRIKKGAFCGTSLLTVSIPASVEFVSEMCFFECESLQSVTFDGGSKLDGGDGDLLRGYPLDCS